MSIPHTKQKTIERRERRHRFLMAVAIGLVVAPSTFGQAPSVQSRRGDIPASPWANRTNEASEYDYENADVSRRDINPRDLVRQPRNPSRTQRSFNENSPAPVTLLGPARNPQESEAPNPSHQKQSSDKDPSFEEFDNSTDPRLRVRPPRTTYSFPAEPKHALTQRKPSEAQSGWQRVQAGGRVIDDYPQEETFSRRGLPDRVETNYDSSPKTKMASSVNGLRQDPIRLGSPNGLSDSNPQLNAAERPQFQNVPVVEVPVQEIEADREIELSARSTPIQNRMDVAKDVESAKDRELNEIRGHRIALAQRVSQDLLSPSSIPASRAPEMLESLPGWQSIEKELKERLERCDSLLKRGAVHSAREETIQGMRRLFRVMDAHRRNRTSETALDKALVALKEEFDFQNLRGNAQSSTITATVASHATEALKGRPLGNVSPEIASQHYRMYARYELLVAADGHQWAADLLYAFGKTLEKESEQDSDRAIALKSQSVVCYQAAAQVSPNQSEVSNQLGFALINLDRADEAYQALTVSLQTRPTSNAWNNLAELYRRRGAMAEADYATKQAEALAVNEKKFSYENPEVTELDPAVFAKYSPMRNLPNQQVSNPGATAIQPAPTPRTASTKSGFFSKIFH